MTTTALVGAAIVGFVVPLAPGKSGATTIAWNGSVDSDASNGDNWNNSGAVPAATDGIQIKVTGTTAIYGTAANIVDSADVRDGHLQVSPTGQLSVTTDMRVRGAGELTVDDGGELDVGGLLRIASTVATINGMVTGDTRVSGTGAMTISATGSLVGDLELAGTNPSVTVDDMGGITGNVHVTAGRLDLDGALTGDLDTTGGDPGTVIDIGATGSVSGLTTITTGTATVDGALDGGLSQSGGTVEIRTGGTVSSGASVTGGDLSIAGTVDGGLTQSGGLVTIEAAGGVVNDGAQVSGGRLNIDGNLTGDLVQTAGIVRVRPGGEINGNADVSGTADLAIAGLMTGDLTQTGGTVRIRPLGRLVGNADVSGDALLGISGLLDGHLTQSGGTVSVNTGGRISGGAEVSGATSTLGIAGTLDGGLTQTGGVVTVEVGGEINGDVDVSDTAELHVDGDLNGNLDQNGGSVEVAGAINGDADVSLGGLTISGLLDGHLTQSGGMVSVNTGGRISGGAEVSGATSTLGIAGTLDGGLTQSDGMVTVSADGVINGGADVSGGSLDIAGALNDGLTQTGGVVTVEAGGTIAGDVVIAPATPGDALLQVDGLVRGNVTNTGGIVDLSVMDTGSIIGDVTNNNGLIHIGGLSTGAIVGNVVNNGGVIDLGPATPGTPNSGLIVGNVTNTASAGGGTISMATGATGDSLVIDGDLIGRTTLNIDVNIETADAGTADLLTVTGTIDSAIVVNVDAVTGAAGYTIQAGIEIIDAGSLAAGIGLDDLELNGLPTDQNALIIYNLQTRADANGTDIVLVGSVNQAAGGVAAAMSLVDDMMSTMINRPRDGAFISGLLIETEDNCSTGTWGRITGGRANGSSTTGNAASGLSPLQSSGRLTFSGFQAGMDIGCYNDFVGGVDLVGGVLVGYNRGSGTQIPDINAPTINTTFDQSYFGAYASVVNGAWSANFQVRSQRSNYSFRSPSLNLFDQSNTTVNSMAFSGNLQYQHALANGWSLTPALGFSITRSQGTTLELTESNGPTARSTGTLTVAPFTSQVGYVSFMASRMHENEENRSFYGGFAQVAYYHDFSGARAATLVTPGATATNTLLTSATSPTYAELALGLSYVRTFGGEGANERQMAATLRGDVRSGNGRMASAITAQFRLNF